MVGVSDGYLRQLSLDGLGPAPTLATPGAVPTRLGRSTRFVNILLRPGRTKRLAFQPARRAGDKLQIAAVANFKGGSAKTTTALYLCHTWL